jgi:NADH dehydrogenase
MDIRNICVIGGSGFIGRHIVHRLSAANCSVVVPTRRRERAKALLVLPAVDVVEADVQDAGALERMTRGADAVINLVGVLHDGRGNAGFEEAHVALSRKVIAACGRSGVKRLLHMSALGAGRSAPSRYLRTKAEAEDQVRASRLEWTIFRPSVVFGREDRFLNMFAGLLDRLPVVPLACPDARFQPVFVEDVAQAFVLALTDSGSVGLSYDLCGPHVYSLRELVNLVGEITGRRRRVVGLNAALSRLQSAVLEILPGRMMTRDNVRSMQVASVSDAAFPFGVRPASLESVAPEYLSGRTPRARYRAFRDHARRGH